MSSPIVIVDVGARGGMHHRWRGQAVRFVGFEPDPPECEKLNNPPNEIYLPYALWSERATKTLYLVESPHGASVLEPNYEFIDRFIQRRFYQPKGTLAFDTVTLDFALSTVDVAEVDLLKIDVEGAEMEILKGATSTLGNVLAIELEVWFNPVQKGAPSFADIDPVLRAAGFQLFDLAKSNFFQRDSRWPKGQLVAGDALYFRVGLQLERDRLDRYIRVILAYGMFDYALEVIRDAACLAGSEKQEWTSTVLRTGKRRSFRGQNRVARFLSDLGRRLATFEKDHLGNPLR